MISRYSRISKNGRRLLGLLACLGVAAILGISAWTAYTAQPRIVAELDTPSDTFTKQEIEKFRSIEPQCIIVLGAGVYSDGTPTPMLKNRLDTGIALYKAKAAPKILLTGDNGQQEYNEVAAMLQYTLDKGIPNEDVFLDYAGFSTYDSVYRAKAIFLVEKAVIVTQTYHLFRALNGCKSMGIEALGAGSDQESYAGATGRELREILARDKDWLKWKVKPEPTFLGDEIPIDGDGTVTQ